MLDGPPRSTDVLPEGARLLHIGPHKTGTTSLQAALFASRPALLEQGVRHVGRTRNPSAAVRAVTGQAAPTTPGRPPSIRLWKDLVGEIRRAGQMRTVVSSESFAWARPEVIERIAAELDPERLHAVVTLRPLGRILPSQWQQNVQAGTATTYQGWLEQVFGTKPVRARRAFWRLHRHDELIARWAAVLGTDHVTAVVVDERDRGMLPHAFEALLGLRPGTIAAPDHDLSNRSMTLPEVEAVRAFNAAAETVDVPRAVHAKAMRFGAAMHMKQRVPEPAEPRIRTPQWALDRAREADLEIVRAIEASGVRVIGDLASLTEPVEGGAAVDPATVAVPPDVAAEMAVGILLASGLAREQADGARTPSVEPIEVARVSTWQLAGVLAHRSLDTAARALRRRRRRGSSPTGE